MRHVLGLLAILLALAGCGDDDGEVTTNVDEPAVEAVLVHATAAGGDPATEATLLPDDDAVAAYAGQFDDAFAADVQGAAHEVEVGDDEVLAAQVVAIGCDVPPAAEVVGSGADVTFVPATVASPMRECLAPVTTVALAAVPD